MPSFNEYNRKRDFTKTKEPSGKKGVRSGKRGRKSKAPIFVVQEHHARRLHWDFRLELDGVLKSWAVTREPSLDPSDRRLAVETEDHPLEYSKFHGEIRRGEYGAGTVKIWDNGTFEEDKPLRAGLEAGLVEVVLKGRRLKGRFILVRTRSEGTRANWLFFKAKPRIAKLRIPDVERIIAGPRGKKAA